MPRKDELGAPDKDVMRFIKRHIEGGESIATLTEAYGVSRATGYNWLHRYNEKILADAKHVGMPRETVAKVEARSLKAEIRRLTLELHSTRGELLRLMMKYGEM